MKIGLNATCFNDRPSGAKQRFVGLYGELMRRMPDAEFVVYEPVDCHIEPWFEKASNVTFKKTPIPSEGRVRKYIGGARYWRSTLLKEKFDIFEQFNLPIVKSPIGQTLLTVHDIRGVGYGGLSLRSRVHSALVKKSLGAANHIITVSETMKEEILDFYPNIPVTVIYNGLDARNFRNISKSNVSSVCHKYDLPEQFILAVGHLETRKNYLLLVSAIARLRDRRGPLPLVIVGNDSGEKKEIEERVCAEGLSSHVSILSNLDDLEVRCIYHLCSLFVFPSSYEGFGIPILEAMAAGCPMVLSDIPVFREITQSKANYFPASDIDEMATVLEEVLFSKDESDRSVEYGRERIRDFNFQNLSMELEELYRLLLER